MVLYNLVEMACVTVCRKASAASIDTEFVQNPGDSERQCRGVRRASVDRLVSVQTQHQTRHQAATTNETQRGR